MVLYYNFLICVLYVVAITALQEFDNDITSNVLDEAHSAKNYSDADTKIIGSKDLLIEKSPKKTVKIDLYYECLCPYSVDFYVKQFTRVVSKLSGHITINTYPYGNAKTSETDGVIHFKCQHGPEECYGNKLHACALDILGNGTDGLMFNGCLINSDSNDAAVEMCGRLMKVKAKPIKQCAKGDKGTELLKHYGEESKKANFHYVPYVLIDGKVNDGDDFLNEVCAAFAVPPPECNKE